MHNSSKTLIRRIGLALIVLIYVGPILLSSRGALGQPLTQPRPSPTPVLDTPTPTAVQPTATNTPVPQPSPTNTPASRPTATPVATATNTPRPTATQEPVGPTATSEPPQEQLPQPPPQPPSEPIIGGRQRGPSTGVISSQGTEDTTSAADYTLPRTGLFDSFLPWVGGALLLLSMFGAARFVRWRSENVHFINIWRNDSKD